MQVRPQSASKVRGLPFATIPLAIASGRTLLAAGAGWGFEVLDDKGDVVALESDIRDEAT